MVRLNVALVARNPAETLTPSLVTESVNDVDAVFQQLRYDAVSRLRQRLRRAYSTVRVPARWSWLLFPGFWQLTYLGKVSGAGMLENRSRQNVVQPRPSKVLQKPHALEGLVWVLSRYVSSVLLQFD